MRERQVDEPLLEEEAEDHEQTKISSSSREAAGVLNLSNTILGTAILALPYCFRILGLLGGLLAIVLVGSVTDASLRFLVHTTDISNKTTLRSLSRHYLGPKLGDWAIILCIVGNNYGILVINLIIDADVLSGTDQLEGVLEQITNIDNFPWWQDRTVVLAVLVSLVLLPLCAAPSLSSQRATSLAAIFTSLCTIFFFLIRLAYGTAHGLVLPALWPDWKHQPMACVSTLAIMFTAYMCHYNLHPIYQSVRSPTRMRRVCSLSLLVSSIVYCSLSTGALFLFGTGTQPDILLNFRRNSFLDVSIKLSYATKLVFTFPVVFYELRETISSLLLPNGRKHWQTFVITLLLLASMYAVALLVPNISVGFQFIGSTMAVALGYIIPASILLKSGFGGGQSQGWLAPAAWFVLAFGVVAGSLGLADAFYNVF